MKMFFWYSIMFYALKVLVCKELRQEHKRGSRIIFYIWIGFRLSKILTSYWSLVASIILVLLMKNMLPRKMHYKRQKTQSRLHNKRYMSLSVCLCLCVLAHKIEKFRARMSFQCALKEMFDWYYQGPDSLDISQFCFPSMWLTLISQDGDNNSWAKRMEWGKDGPPQVKVGVHFNMSMGEWIRSGLDLILKRCKQITNKMLTRWHSWKDFNQG